LVIRPNLARQKLSNKLEAEAPTRGPEIEASHILVATQEAAKAIVDQTLKTKDFADVAKAQSADTTTAVNGGELGWLPKGIMTPEFDKVAFALKVGEVSQPFQTKYGWEIVKVTAIDPDRPITAETLSQLRTLKLNDWLESERGSAKIGWDIGAPIPSPTAQTQFVPPPDAPPTPTPLPTPTPPPAPSGTPGAATPAP
jgi:parvulin-like peptidyl-prolyl isomerase